MRVSWREAEQKLVYAGYVFAHLGDRERAVGCMKRGVAAQSGATFAQLPSWDLDLEPLWGYAPFEELVKSNG